MARFIRPLLASVFWLACAAPALGDSFFLRYDADGTFPEEEGWSRSSGDYPDGKVARSIEDGVFRINSLESYDCDLYGLRSPDLTPGLGELLRVNWRMRVLQQGDPGVPDWPGEIGMRIWVDGNASFRMAPDSISVLTAGMGYRQVCSLAPAVWHTYSFSTNAEHCDLSVDGQLVFQSTDRESETPYPLISWGDSCIGGSGGSESEWDYVQVSIVPEPGGIVIGLVAVVVCLRAGRKGI